MWRPKDWKNPFKRFSLDGTMVATLENGSRMNEYTREVAERAFESGANEILIRLFVLLQENKHVC